MPLEKESLNNFLPDGFETNNLEGYKENFSADKIATGYEKDVKDRVSGPNFNNLLDVIGKNTNVLTKFMDFIKNMPVNNLFAVDENNQLVYKNLDEVGGGGLEIGDIGIAPLGIDESKGKRRYLNGQIILQEPYQSFTAKLKEAVALYPSLACTESEWQTTATMTVGGQVGKFVVDNDAGTIRLPKIIMPIQGLTDLSKLGEIVEAGLPNITGHFNSEYAIGDRVGGAFYGEDITYPKGIQVSTGSNLDTKVTFDASRSNPTYGNSNTVQQEQIQYPYFIQVATGAETKDEITNEHELVNPYVLLEPKFFETPVYNLSWLISNGSFTGSKAVHPHAYDALLIELNADIEVGTTQNNYTKRGLPVKLATDSYTDYDFVVNPADETFRPPLKVNLASSKAVAGNGMTLGLTNGRQNVGLMAGGSGAINLVEGVEGNYGDPIGSARGTGMPLDWNKTVGVTTDPTKSGIETSDSNLYLYFYVGEVAQNTNLVNAGRIEEIKANRSELDGQWVIFTELLYLINLLTLVSQTSYTYSLEDLLPNDGHQYEVMLGGIGTTAAATGNTANIYVTTDLSPNNIYTWTINKEKTQAATVAHWGGSINVVVGTGRKIIITNTGTANSSDVNIWVAGYRRIGTNV